MVRCCHMLSQSHVGNTQTHWRAACHAGSSAVMMACEMFIATATFLQHLIQNQEANGPFVFELEKCTECIELVVGISPKQSA